MSDASTRRGETVVTVVFEGSTSKASLDRDTIGVEKLDRALAARTETAGQCGSTLSRDLLSGVDLTPKATEPQGSWGWEIAGYLYLGGLGAGAFIVAVLLDWIGLPLPVALTAVGGRDWNWAAILFYWGPVMTALGASLLIFHLGRNWFLFFTACVNPRSSWLARGFLILATFIIVGGIAAVIAVFFPAWPGTVPAVWRAIQAIGLAFACGTAIYTGILLRSMKYIPAWNLVLLPALFFVSALSTGAMGIALGTLLFRLISGDAALAQSMIRRIETAEPAILLAEGVLLVLYLRHLAKGKPEARLSAAMLLSGPWRRAFWVGVVGGALVLPLLLSGLSAILDIVEVSFFRLFGAEFEVASTLILVAAVAVLCGGFLLRLSVLGVGIKERPPLYGMSMWRAEHGLPLVAADAGEGSGG
jgi:formate-dependent nitrite reductase membrane component NrfD